MRTLLKIFLFVFIPASLLIITIISTTNIVKNKTEICLTRSCNRAASEILDYMDPHVDPCDDFYKHVCGKFLKKDLPEEVSSISRYTINYQKILEEVKILVEKPIQKNNPGHILALKEFYRSCMNTAAIERNSLKTMKYILDKLGGWPIAESENWNLDWMQVMYKFRGIGFSVNYLIELSVEESYNSHITLMNLNQPSLGLEKEYLLRGFSDKTVQAYYEYMVNVAVLLGNDKKYSAKVLKESLIFEIELANITISTSQRRNLSSYYQSMTITELEKNIPGIPWFEYLSTMLGVYIKITNKYVVKVNVPQYFVDFEALMNRTSKEVAANYAIWRAVDASIPYMSESFEEAQLRFLTFLTGRRQKQERWKKCIREMFEACLQKEAKQLYLEKYTFPDYNQQTVEILKHIAKTFHDALHGTSWMDAKTREIAIIKNRKLNVKLDNLDQRYDNPFTGTKGHSDYTFYENNYLMTFLNVRELIFRRWLGAIKGGNFFYGKSVGRFVTSKCTDGFFDKLENLVEIGAGLIQAPFFETNRPQYLNYAGLGLLIAHETAHTIDDEARYYDVKRKTLSWWSPETEEIYWEKVRCLIEQYGNYTVPELNLQVNGVNTMRENLADNRGMDIAYSAYKAWVDRYGVEKRLPGIKYTYMQMFWIFATHLLCRKSKQEFLEWTVLVDDHSPSYFRVLGALRNNKYFAKDFDCPVGSMMNPEKKCELW